MHLRWPQLTISSMLRRGRSSHPTWRQPPETCRVDYKIVQMTTTSTSASWRGQTGAVVTEEVLQREWLKLQNDPDASVMLDPPNALVPAAGMEGVDDAAASWSMLPPSCRLKTQAAAEGSGGSRRLLQPYRPTRLELVAVAAGPDFKKIFTQWLEGMSLVVKDIELDAVSCQFEPYPHCRTCLHAGGALRGAWSEVASTRSTTSSTRDDLCTRGHAWQLSWWLYEACKYPQGQKSPARMNMKGLINQALLGCLAKLYIFANGEEHKANTFCRRECRQLQSQIII